jgi:starch-binding outer membrane protein SusE/F
MKHILKLLFGAMVLGVVFSSCEKDENKNYFEGGTAPVLKATVTTTTPVLNVLLKNDPAITFSWTNPDYRFTTGISSQDVSYTLQIDTTGAGFTNPKIQEKAISKDLSTTLTVGQLNTYLLSIGLVEDLPHNIEFRIKSTINGAVPLFSNVIKMTIQPYLDVVYPVPTNLYITGSATPASWQCGCGEPELISQKFTKVSSSKFELTITLSANNSYLLLPVYGSWSAKYGGTGGNNSNNVTGDAFKPNGSDLKAPATTRSYKITVDFKTGQFSVQ